MRYDFDPYSGADIMDSRDINEYLEDLISEVSEELQETFNISEEDALLFIEYYAIDFITAAKMSITGKQNKIIAKIYQAMDDMGKPRRKQWDDEGRLEKIKDLRELIKGNSDGDWNYGTTLIRDDYFPEYAKEFAEDIGAIKDDAVWPNTCIDWEQATDELRQDYTACEIDGTTYYYR